MDSLKLQVPFPNECCRVRVTIWRVTRPIWRWVKCVVVQQESDNSVCRWLPKRNHLIDRPRIYSSSNMPSKLTNLWLRWVNWQKITSFLWTWWHQNASMNSAPKLTSKKKSWRKLAKFNSTPMRSCNNSNTFHLSAPQNRPCMAVSVDKQKMTIITLESGMLTILIRLGRRITSWAPLCKWATKRQTICATLTTN